MTRQKALEDIKMYMANDWELKEETSEYFLLTRNTATPGKHVVCFLILGWWTLGIANLIYHFMSKKNKKILK